MHTVTVLASTENRVPEFPRAVLRGSALRVGGGSCCSHLRALGKACLFVGFSSCFHLFIQFCLCIDFIICMFRILGEVSN